MWYILWTTAGNEHRLKEHIIRDGDPGLYGEIWIPLRREMRKAGKARKEIEKAIFPGYLFTSTWDPARLHLSIKGYPEYLGILKSCGEYMPLSAEDEGFIKGMGAGNGPAGVSSGFIRSGELHVVSGPLKGLEEYIVKVDRHRMRAVLEMDLFGEKRRFAMGLCVAQKE